MKRKLLILALAIVGLAAAYPSGGRRTVMQACTGLNGLCNCNSSNCCVNLACQGCDGAPPPTNVRCQSIL